MHKIHLEKVQFFARHGFYEEESLTGTRFELDLELQTNFTEGMQSDKLEGTVDYAEVYKICEEEMNIPSKLLEHVAYRISNRIKQRFSEVEKVKLKLSKLNPPLSGEIDKVGISIEC